MDSDHIPVIVELKRHEKELGKSKRKKRRVRKKERENMLEGGYVGSYKRLYIGKL